MKNKRIKKLQNNIIKQKTKDTAVPSGIYNEEIISKLRNRQRTFGSLEKQ